MKQFFWILFILFLSTVSRTTATPQISSQEWIIFSAPLPDGNGWGIYRTSVDDTVNELLYETPDNFTIPDYLMWSSTHQSIFFALASGGPPSTIYQSSVDEIAPIELLAGEGWIRGLDWSPARQQFVLILETGAFGPQLYVLDEVGQLERITDHVIGGSGNFKEIVNWSPNGEWIAFAEGVIGSTGRVYLIRPDGSDLHALTPIGFDASWPAWSPTGEWIAFINYKNDIHHIYLIRPDGSELKQITRKGNNIEPTWSPDGQWLVFTSQRNGDWDLYRIRVDGADLTQITNRLGDEHLPQWIIVKINKSSIPVLDW